MAMLRGGEGCVMSSDAVQVGHLGELRQLPQADFPQSGLTASLLRI